MDLISSGSFCIIITDCHNIRPSSMKTVRLSRWFHSPASTAAEACCGGNGKIMAQPRSSLLHTLQPIQPRTGECGRSAPLSGNQLANGSTRAATAYLPRAGWLRSSASGVPRCVRRSKYFNISAYRKAARARAPSHATAPRSLRKPLPFDDLNNALICDAIKDGNLSAGLAVLTLHIERFRERLVRALISPRKPV